MAITIITMMIRDMLSWGGHRGVQESSSSIATEQNKLKYLSSVLTSYPPLLSTKWGPPGGVLNLQKFIIFIFFFLQIQTNFPWVFLLPLIQDRARIYLLLFVLRLRYSSSSYLAITAMMMMVIALGRLESSRAGAPSSFKFKYVCIENLESCTESFIYWFMASYMIYVLGE